MNREKNLKTLGVAFPTAHITALARDLRSAGYDVERDNSAGTLVAKATMEDGTVEVVVRGLQLGRGRTWMLRADPRVITPTK